MRHVRNRWGEGARLREQIVAAATAVLEESGTEDAVTLRGVARRAGISAPSIYDHFPDREAIVNAVVADAFADLDRALEAATDGETDPGRRLRLLCEAYLAFAERAPHRYRVAFGRHRRTGTGSLPADTPLSGLSGGQAFGRLVAAVAAQTTAGADPQLDATALWVALHGYASLSASVPAFPWPDRGDMLATLLDRMIRH